MTTHLVIVPHTHWDREWYQTHEQFRYRLVQLMDGLLDLLERDPAFLHFTLDGQTILLDDYFEVRPEARDRVEKLVRSGRLLIGPWYVLPDEWLVSGEALIRNLRLGLARAEAMGGSMKIGYVPDQFGHVGQLPQIFASFGMEGAVLWRGVGADIDETLFDWEAADGTRLLTVYLIQGYGNFVHPPLEADRLATRLRQAAAALRPHSRIESLLLMNGSDHVEPLPGLSEALRQVTILSDDLEVEIGTLPGFLERARREAPAERQVHHGELRSGLRSPLLEGCASTRMPQKRADFENDRLLTRYLEPLAAWLGELGGDPDPAMIDLAWRIALENHPHDSICGCSVDAVHRQMDVRFERVADIAGSHLARVTRELGAAVEAPREGFGRGAGQSLVVWNPHGPGVGSVEGCFELDWPLESGRPSVLHLRRAGGQRIPAHIEVEQPGAILAEYRMNAAAAAILVDGFPDEFMSLFAVGFGCREQASGVEVEILLASESWLEVDVAAQKQALRERLESLRDRPTRYCVRRLPRFRLRWVDELPGHGLRVYRLGRGHAHADAQEGEQLFASKGEALFAQKTPDGGACIENGFWRIDVDAEGRVRCEDHRRALVIEDAVRWVDEGDRGDEYTFQPIEGRPVVERPDRVRVRLGRRSEAEVSIRIELRHSVPAGLDDQRRPRGTRMLSSSIELRLSCGLDRVDVVARVDNTACDHRLRLHLRSPFAAEVFEVESAFEVAQRPIDPQPSDFGSERPSEFPIGCTPQRSFATLTCERHGFTVSNRGSAEVEAVTESDGTTSLAVTVFRAVGWLSREDLSLRPGHAGPALETPGAQVPGVHVAELAFRIHEPAAPDRTQAAHRHAVPALAFRGGVEQGVLGDGSRLLEVDAPELVVSAIEPRNGAGSLVRLYNTSRATVSSPLRWNGKGRELEAVDHSGRHDAGVDLETDGQGVQQLTLRGCQMAGLRPR